MKKICILLILATVLLCSCSKKNDTVKNNGSSNASNSTSDSADPVNKDKSEKVHNDASAYDVVDAEGGVEIILFHNDDNAEYDRIVIPSEINGKPVVGIGCKGEKYNLVMSSIYGDCEVVIPPTVQYIEYGAFEGAEGLTKLSGGENCKEIGEIAFRNCRNLKEITFIDSVETIADDAFAGCTAWEEAHS